MYTKWMENPIIIGPATQPSSVWEVPYPAITICSDTKFNHEAFDFRDWQNKIVKEQELNVTE